MESEFLQRLLDSADSEREALLTQAGDIGEEDVLQLAGQARAQASARPAEALRLADVVWHLAERLNSARARAHAQRARALALRALGRWQDALNTFDAGVDWANQAGDALLAAQIPIAAVEALAQLGRYDEALKQARELEARLRALGADEDAAKVVGNLGLIYFQREAYEEALACWQRALDWFETHNASAAVARLQMNMGNVLTHLHRLPEALQMYARARQELEAGGMQLLVAGLDGNVGFLLFLAGRYTEALQAFARAQAGFETLHLPKDLAKCDREVADVYLALNLTPEALAAYERTLPIFRELQMTLETVRSQTGMAGALFSQGREREGFALLTEAEQTLTREQNTAGIARICLLRAGQRWHGQNEQTGASVNETASLQTHEAIRIDINIALRHFRHHKVPLGEAQTRLLRAEVHVGIGKRPVRALKHLLRDAETYQWISLLWRIEAGLARTALNGKQPRAALNRFRRAVQAVERLRLLMPGEDFRIAFLRDKMRLYEEMLALLLDKGTPAALEEGLQLIERAKSRTLMEQMATATSAPDASRPEQQELRQRLEDLRAQLNWNYAAREQFEDSAQRLPRPDTPLPSGVQELEQEYLRVQRQWQILHADGKAAATGAGQRTTSSGRKETTPIGGISMKSLQAQLKGEQIIEYILLRDEVLACIISAHGARTVRGLASVPEVREQINRLRFQWTKAGSRAYGEQFEAQLCASTQQVLTRLYELLWEPLVPYLNEERLTIIPHGLLHEVPFHALYDGDKHVLDRWECAYAPSSAVWQHCRLREPAQATHSLLIGISEPGIAHVRTEMDALKQQLPNLRVVEEEAATLSALPQEGAYRYLHFATHARFRQDNPLFSGLRFWDGWLIAYDLYRRHLDCHLATLSACHTGMNLVTAGDELLGLVRGFLAAGARSVLVSLWAAHDPTTAQLMPAFYTRAETGMRKAAALRAAQIQLRESYPHPYYWASFAMIGER